MSTTLFLTEPSTLCFIYLASIALGTPSVDDGSYAIVTTPAVLRPARGLYTKLSFVNRYRSNDKANLESQGNKVTLPGLMTAEPAKLPDESVVASTIKSDFVILVAGFAAFIL